MIHLKQKTIPAVSRLSGRCLELFIISFEKKTSLMISRALVTHCRHKPFWPTSLIWADFATMLSLEAAHGQTSVPIPDTVAPVVSPSSPAEVQPGHPLSSTTGRSRETSPQNVAPIPLPPGSGADTPNGSARDGVITPPGSPGGNPQVVPK